MKPIPGSERVPLDGARDTGPRDRNETVEVSVIVRDPADFAAVRSFGEQSGLTVIEESAPRRTIRLSGNVAQMQVAFGVTLRTYECERCSYRGRVGPVYVSDALDGIVVAVLGLDNRPQAATHFRIATAGTSFTPVQIASLYDFPAGDASGQCVALIELGGGFQTSDIQAYFAALKLPVPDVVAVSVDGAKNAPTGDTNGPDTEVMLDIDVVGAAAPGARIAVYFAPNTDAGFLDAITTALHDTTNKPSVISISWGSAESEWTQQAMSSFDAAFQAAATMGVTIAVASGDNGSTDGVAGGGNHVDFPASDSYALACGGTTLEAGDAAIASETVWNELAEDEGATGGGVSATFPLPSWQANLKVTDSRGVQSALSVRGVPDVAGDADPATGYSVRVDGSDMVIGGTSAVAPLWAALIALINAARGTPVGFINPKLYAGPKACNDITSGNNGAFEASAGWDACTGLGSPNGRAVAALLSG